MYQGLPAILERRHQTLRIDAQVIGPALIVAPQMDRGGFVIELFQIESDADAERGRGSEIAVELHRERGPLGPFSVPVSKLRRCGSIRPHASGRNPC